MSATRPSALATTPPTQPMPGRRVLRMAVAWAGLGAVMGASVGWESGGVIGTIACLIAGMIELAALGAVLGLIGGRPGESLLGGGCGLTVGAVAGLAGVQAGPVPAAFGLVVGALAGATLRPYLRLVALPIVLLVRVLPSRHGRWALAIDRCGPVSGLAQLKLGARPVAPDRPDERSPARSSAS
jgi:hypothetical protein